MTIDYANTGGSDIPAPLLELSADKATLKLPEQSSFQGNELPILAIDPDGPAGVLPLGFHGTVTVAFEPTTTDSNASIAFTLSGLTSASENLPINWASVETSFRPPSVQSDAWSAIFTNYLGIVGGTAGQFQAGLTEPRLI